MTAPTVDVELEELWAESIPCEGCALGDGRNTIIECDNPAEVRMVWSHNCPLFAPLKCRDCERRHIADLAASVREFGEIQCWHCRKCFPDVASFVRYAPLG